MKDPDVLALFSVMGFSFSGAALEHGIMFARLKPFDRPARAPSTRCRRSSGGVGGPLFGIPGAIVVGVPAAVDSRA